MAEAIEVTGASIKAALADALLPLLPDSSK